MGGPAISKPSIARSTATMSVATTLSRVTGFVRTWATAYALGATGALAASYSVANNVPNMIYELVAGGILSALFIPSVLEIKARRGEDEAWRFASHVLNLSVLALGLVAIAGTLLPAPFIWTQTFRLPAGGDQTVREVAGFFFRFFAIQIVVYGAGMVIQGVLNAQRRYLWTALGPVFNNLVVIATMFAVARIGADSATGLTVLAIGTTLGVVAMFSVMLPDLRRSGIRYYPELGLSDPDVRRMLALALPSLLYVATNIVAVSVRNASAFAVGENGPALLMYAWNFYQLPYGILAVALATAVFTEMSEAAGNGDMDEFKRHFSSGLRTTGVLILPSAAALFALATPLVTLYRAGAFAEESVAPVATVLRLWAIALVFFAAMMFVLRAFYSLKDTRTPALVNLLFTGVQIALYLTLTSGFAAWSGLGVSGVPIADAVFYVLMFVALTAMLRRKIGSFDLSGVAMTFGKMALAALLGGSAAYGTTRALATTSGIAGAALQVTLGGIACFAVALTAARLLGVREVASLGTMVSGRLPRLRKR